MDEHNGSAPAPHSYERSTIDSRRIAIAFAALVGILIITASVTFWLLQRFSADGQLPLVAPRADELPAPPAPRLQSAPSRDIDAYRRTQAARLHDYRWIDPQRGIVQIPIERAMAIEVERAHAGAGAHP